MTANATEIQTQINTLVDLFKEQARTSCKLKVGIVGKIFNPIALIKLVKTGKQTKATADALEKALGITLENTKESSIEQLKRIEAAAKALEGVDVSQLSFTNDQVEKIVANIKKDGFTLESIGQHVRAQIESEPKFKEMVFG